MHKRIFTFLLILFLTGNSGASILDGEVEFDAFDAADVDALIAAHTRLADAFEGFLDMPLSEAIDKFQTSIHEELQCAADVTAKGLELGLKRAMPDWDVLKGEAQQACRHTSPVDFGEAGISATFEFNNCVIKEALDRRLYTMKSVKTAYLGLLEYGNAEMCANKNKPESTGYRTAKEHFGYAGTRALLWEHLDSIDGCETTEQVYDCIKQFVNEKRQEVLEHNSLDWPVDDPDILAELADSIEGFGIFGSTTRFNVFRDGVPRDHLESYEKAGLSALRLYQLTEAIFEARKNEFVNEVETLEKSASSISTNCKAKRPVFLTHFCTAHSYVDQCNKLQKENRFADLESLFEPKQCVKVEKSAEMIAAKLESCNKTMHTLELASFTLSNRPSTVPFVGATVGAVPPPEYKPLGLKECEQP